MVLVAGFWSLAQSVKLVVTGILLSSPVLSDEYCTYVPANTRFLCLHCMRFLCWSEQRQQEKQYDQIFIDKIYSCKDAEISLLKAQLLVKEYASLWGSNYWCGSIIPWSTECDILLYRTIPIPWLPYRIFISCLRRYCNAVSLSAL